MFRKLISIYGLLKVFYYISSFVLVCFLRNIFFGHDLIWTLNRRKQLVPKLLKSLHVKVHFKGVIPQGNFIYIANHRSYLDPVVMHRDVTFLPVAKAEIASWPVIGYGAKITGVLYVKRENQTSRRNTRIAMVDTFEKGHSICIYPEGTTHTEPQTIEFRMGTFKIAAENNFPIIPVAIEYKDEKDAWIGKDTFLPHLFRLSAKRQIDVRMAFGNPVFDSDPIILKNKVQNWIDVQLTQFRTDWDLPLATQQKEEFLV